MNRCRHSLVQVSHTNHIAGSVWLCLICDNLFQAQAFAVKKVTA